MRLKTIRLKKTDSYLPPEIRYEDFTHLEIFGGQLETLPQWPFEKEGLLVLRIKNCCLKQLPEFINPSMCKLQTLSLSQNEIEILPQWIYQLHSLKVLDISANKISHLKSAPQNLERLTLDSNCLQELPNDLFNLKKLLHLSVGGNPLSRGTIEMLHKKFGIWAGDD